jgi:UDP-glucose 4-epimerase
MVLVTGAAGQVGGALSECLRAKGNRVLATDIGSCDLRSDADVAALFGQGRFTTVVHLAGVLPTAFRSDPLTGADVNLSGTLRLLRACVDAGVGRFVFGSSASVYGNAMRPPCSETSPPSPDDAYGAAKLAIEMVLEQLGRSGAMNAVSVRIGRVLGPGATKTGSPWRSRMFERSPAQGTPLRIPFAPGAVLSVIHVDDLARVLRTLVEAPSPSSAAYNTPAQHVTAAEIGRVAGSRGWAVEFGDAHAGPELDGTRFVQEFGFRPQPLEEYAGGR